jgi:hypothetical protein
MCAIKLSTRLDDVITLICNDFSVAGPPFIWLYTRFRPEDTPFRSLLRRNKLRRPRLFLLPCIWLQECIFGHIFLDPRFQILIIFKFFPPPTCSHGLVVECLAPDHKIAGSNLNRSIISSKVRKMKRK